MIVKTIYKDRFAVEVKSKNLTAVILPDDGGKIVSLYDDEQKFLKEAPGEKYKLLTADGSYVDAECSGFDDMFPTIDPYTPAYGENAGITYPDHGEVCRSKMETEISDNKVALMLKSRLFNTTFKKIVTAENDDTIAIRYILENHGIEPYAYIWAAHCMLDGIDSANVVTPFVDGSPVRIMFGSDFAETLSRKQPGRLDSSIAECKYYYLDAVPEGFCGYRFPEHRKELIMQFPKEKVPYLGVWINNGAVNGMHNIALEPCTAPFDRPDAAREAGCESFIPADGTVKFTLRLIVRTY